MWPPAPLLSQRAVPSVNIAAPLPLFPASLLPMLILLPLVFSPHCALFLTPPLPLFLPAPHPPHHYIYSLSVLDSHRYMEAMEVVSKSYVKRLQSQGGQ